MDEVLVAPVLLTATICLGGIVVIAAGITTVFLLRGGGRRRSLQAGLWLGIVPWLAPAALTTLAGGVALVAVPVLLGGASAPGRVVENTLIFDGAGDPVYMAVVEFETAAGEPVRFDDPLAAANPPQYAVGQSVTVIYPPEAPQQALIDEPLLRVLPIVLLGLAGLALIIGFVLAGAKFRSLSRSS
ncbi:MAG: DUF3592 domain-containing protein [Anaerolineales bacterium]|nr:DUF3592 domain-containing protein [Anaerolineales bacterium]